jgi:hypothetical protein
MVPLQTLADESGYFYAGNRGNLMGQDVDRYVFYYAAMRTCVAGSALCKDMQKTCQGPDAGMYR